jgi:hypothetical protein
MIQGEQRVYIAVEHARNDLGHAFGNGITEQVVQIWKGTGQQTQQRLKRFAVVTAAQDMKPAEQQ